jgi:hypothetical protein
MKLIVKTAMNELHYYESDDGNLVADVSNNGTLMIERVTVRHKHKWYKSYSIHRDLLAAYAKNYWCSAVASESS